MLAGKHGKAARSRPGTETHVSLLGPSVFIHTILEKLMATLSSSHPMPARGVKATDTLIVIDLN